VIKPLRSCRKCSSMSPVVCQTHRVVVNSGCLVVKISLSWCFASPSRADGANRVQDCIWLCMYGAESQQMQSCMHHTTQSPVGVTAGPEVSTAFSHFASFLSDTNNRFIVYQKSVETQSYHDCYTKCQLLPAYDSHLHAKMSQPPKSPIPHAHADPMIGLCSA